MSRSDHSDGLAAHCSASGQLTPFALTIVFEILHPSHSLIIDHAEMGSEDTHQRGRMTNICQMTQMPYDILPLAD